MPPLVFPINVPPAKAASQVQALTGALNTLGLRELATSLPTTPDNASSAYTLSTLQEVYGALCRVNPQFADRFAPLLDAAEAAGTKRSFSIVWSRVVRTLEEGALTMTGLPTTRDGIETGPVVVVGSTHPVIRLGTLTTVVNLLKTAGPERTAFIKKGLANLGIQEVDKFWEDKLSYLDKRGPVNVTFKKSATHRFKLSGELSFSGIDVTIAIPQNRREPLEKDEIANLVARFIIVETIYDLGNHPEIRKYLESIFTGEPIPFIAISNNGAWQLTESFGNSNTVKMWQDVRDWYLSIERNVHEARPVITPFLRPYEYQPRQSALLARYFGSRAAKEMFGRILNPVLIENVAIILENGKSEMGFRFDSDLGKRVPRIDVEMEKYRLEVFSPHTILDIILLAIEARNRRLRRAEHLPEQIRIDYLGRGTYFADPEVIHARSILHLLLEDSLGITMRQVAGRKTPIETSRPALEKALKAITVYNRLHAEGGSPSPWQRIPSIKNWIIRESGIKPAEGPIVEFIPGKNGMLLHITGNAKDITASDWLYVLAAIEKNAGGVVRVAAASHITITGSLSGVRELYSTIAGDGAFTGLGVFDPKATVPDTARPATSKIDFERNPYYAAAQPDKREDYAVALAWFHSPEFPEAWKKFAPLPTDSRAKIRTKRNDLSKIEHPDLPSHTKELEGDFQKAMDAFDDVLGIYER